MKVGREIIENALFALLSSNLKQQDGIPGNVFVTVGQRLRPWNEVDASEQPAAFLVNDKQRVDQNQALGLSRNTLYFFLFVYNFYSGDPEAVPSIPLNRLLDLVDKALTSIPPGEAQTLGGLVTDCSIQGDIEIVDGILGQQSIATVPIQILVGS